MTKKKLLTTNPLDQEYQAKITATSMALSGFYSEAMNAIIEGNDRLEAGLGNSELVKTLDEISIKWASKIVDDISPKRSVIV